MSRAAIGRFVSLIAAGSLLGSMLAVAPLAQAEEPEPAPTPIVEVTPAAAPNPESEDAPTQAVPSQSAEQPSESPASGEASPPSSPIGVPTPGETVVVADTSLDPESSENPAVPDDPAPPASFGAPVLASESDGGITGKVRDANNQPIDEVTVVAWLRYGNGGRERVADTQTGAEGTYHIAGLAQGSYLLEFSKPQADYVTVWWKGVTNENVATAVPVSSGQDTNLDEPLTLAAGGSISGTVTNQIGAPLSPFYVHVYAASDRTLQVAWVYVYDDSGEFTIHGLPVGSYVLKIEPTSDYLAQWWNGKSTSESASVIGVEVGKTTSLGTIKLASGRGITGIVNDKDGNPIQGVDVWVSDAGGSGSDMHHAYTGADGTYRVPGLREGSYKLQFIKYNSLYLRQWWPGVTDSAAATPVVVSSDQDTNLVEPMVMRVGGSITGWVHNASDAPLAGIQVTASTAGSSPTTAGDATTDADGKFVIGGLVDGEYKLQFYGSPGLDYLTQWWPNASSSNNAGKIPVAAEQPVVLDDPVMMQQGGSIKGTIQGWVDNASSAYVSVYAYPADQPYTQAGSGWVDQAGEFTISSLPAGDYRILFSPWGDVGDYLYQWWDGVEDVGQATPVTVRSGEQTPMSVALALRASVSGTVTGVDGPLTSGYVLLYRAGAENDDDTYQSAYLTSDGKYSFESVWPGAYKLQVRPSDGVHLPQWWNGPDMASAGVITLASGGSSTVDVQVSAGAKISGSVTYSGGAVARNVEVILRSGDEWLQGSDAEDGTYSFGAVAPGTYTLEVNYGAGMQLIDGPFLVGSADVTRNLVLDPGTTISGTITGVGPASAWVDVYRQSGGRLAGADVAADGTYTVYGLTAEVGSVTVRAAGDGLPRRYLGDGSTLRGATFFTLADGSVIGKDINLGGAVITGTVRGKDAAALKDVEVTLVSRTGRSDAWVHTDDNGNYIFSGVPGGDYTLRFSADDDSYATQWWPGGAARNQAVYFAVAGSESLTREVTLAAPSRIFGSVSSQVPNTEVNVILYEQTDDGLDWVDSTYLGYSSTEFSFDVDPGTYLLRFSVHDETGSYVSWWQNSASWSSAKELVVGQGEQVDLKTVELTAPPLPTGSVSGSIAIGSGADPQGFHAELVSLVDGGFYQSVDVESDGSFRFANVPAGDYRLSAYASSSSVHYEETYFPDVVDLAKAQIVVVGEGETSGLVVKMVERTTSLRGQVVAGGDRQPVPGTYVVLYRVGSGYELWVDSRTTDDTGAFDFGAALIPGYGYKLEAYISGYGWRDQTFTAGDAAASVDLVVDQRDWNSSITGTVLDEGSQPVDDLEVEAHLEGQPYDWDTGYTDRQGRFEVTDLRAGTYKVRFGNYSSSQSYYAPAWLDRSVTLDDHDTEDVGTVHLARAAGISGAAYATVNGHQLWLDDAQVTLKDSSGAELAVGWTGWYRAPGTFGFTVPQGTFEVCVSPPEGKKYSSLRTACSTVKTTVGKESDIGNINLSESTGQLIAAGTPSILGDPMVGKKLEASPGSWLPSDVVLTYQWLRDDVAIDGATSASYTLVAGDQGKRISVRVTGSKAGLTSVSQTSAKTAAVAGVPVTPTLVAGVPTVGGSAVVGSTLTANEGSWSPAPDAYTYQWQRNGSAISGATGRQHVLTAADLGAVISVQVSGTKSGYKANSATSAKTAGVAAGTLSAGTPSVSGEAKFGSTLSATAGSWGPGPMSLSYQWLRAGAPIPGATGSSYTLGFDDWAGSISVRVTGSLAGYTSVSREASAVAANAITGMKFSKPVVPTISGKAAVGSKLTAKVKAWKPKSSKFGYQWLKNGQPIPGATASTYVIKPEDAGGSFKVRVAGLLSGYQPLTKDSKATKKVPVPLVAAGKVSVSGKAKVGTTLTVKAGAWKPAGVTLAYQWLRNGKAIVGETGSTYLVRPGDVKAAISVKVTGSKAWFKSVVKTSKKTGKVKA